MGRSGKLPSGASAKLKRWKKGHSSDSNPATCRHRQAARSRFFSRPSGSPAVGVLGRRLVAFVLPLYTVSPGAHSEDPPLELDSCENCPLKGNGLSRILRS